MNTERHIDLNVSSVYSKGESLLSPEEIADFAIADGAPAAAVTDLNGVSGFYDFDRKIKQCQFEGNRLKAIYGTVVNYYEGGHKPADECLKRITLLVRSGAGLTNLYKIITEACRTADFEEGGPAVSLDFIMSHREGLLLGQHCPWTEIDDFPEQDDDRLNEYLTRQFSIGDYIEIRPLPYASASGGQRDDSPVPMRKRVKDIICRLMEQEKICVAVSGAQYTGYIGELCCRILQDEGEMEPGAARMMTTEEMMESFSFLPKEAAGRLVIDNPAQIADLIDADIELPNPDNHDDRVDFPDADEKLAHICEERAHSLYGDELPEIVKERLYDELGKIKTGGWASRYLLAKMIADKSDELGHIHSTRGGAGSSFVAFLAGITEINPLPPHYRCPKCRGSRFPEPGKYSSGFDLEAKDCPYCKEKMIRDGHNIPPETFLGINGEKEPVFDFNIDHEIFDELFRYLEEIFGQGHIAVAGVRSGWGYKERQKIIKTADRYLSKKHIVASDSEKDEVVDRLLLFQSNEIFGRHPGKILISQNNEISEYTPVRYEAGKGADLMPAGITDYHELGYCLEEIDLFGNDILMELRLMEQSTGFAARDIEIPEIDIAGFFTHHSLPGIFSGSDERNFEELPCPVKFSDIVDDLGLFHGTWNEGLICYRDDVLLCLKDHGIDTGDAYRIAEYVRRGKAWRNGIPARDVSLMSEAGLPEAYIESMTKVKYLFPKAHLVSLALNYLRKIYYKIHHPAEFYAAVLTVHDISDCLDAEILLKGKEEIAKTLTKFRKEWNGKLERDGEKEDIELALEIALECYDRGIRFVPSDISAGTRNQFTVADGNIRLPIKDIH